MTDTAENLPPNTEKMLAALLSHPTIKAAARSAGVSESSIYRALRDEQFAEAYRAGRREVTQHTIMRLQARSSEAAEILFRIAKDKTAPASARVSAARAIIEQAIDGAKTTELIERVDALQKAIEGQGKR